MKIQPLLFFFLFMALVPAGAAFGQAKSGPAETAKTFYKWYLHELNAEQHPEDNKAKMRQFISDRLAKWTASKAYEEYDADYFLDAQDWGQDWENNITISKVVTSGNAATLRVTLVQPPSGPSAGMGNKILDLKLLKEHGLWKIDRITGKH